MPNARRTLSALLPHPSTPFTKDFEFENVEEGPGGEHLFECRVGAPALGCHPFVEQELLRLRVLKNPLPRVAIIFCFKTSSCVLGILQFLLMDYVCGFSCFRFQSPFLEECGQ